MGMVRIHVQMEKDLHQRLRAEATRRGVSVAALVREMVGEHLAVSGPTHPDYSKLWALVGSGRSGKSDVSTHHDDYLAGLRE